MTPSRPSADGAPPAPPGERLQKALAAAGFGSRRAIEEWIRAGRISVNGAPAELGTRVAAGDRVTLDGRVIEWQLREASGSTAVLGYHKPLGEVTTRHDPQGRPTVFERLPAPPAGRWIAVGRLDVNTAGLLLFTNDGELAHRLMHPSSQIEREYLVRVRAHPSREALQQLQGGILLEDGWAKFDRLEPVNASDGHAWFRAVLHEGRNREVRRLWAAVDHEVSRLTRLRYGPVMLPDDLRAGQARLLPPSLVAELTAATGRGALSGASV